MTRQHAPIILLFLAGALATLLSLTAIRTAGAAPLATEWTAPLPPSDAIDGVEDVRDAARSHGWALGALVGLILVGRTMRRARRRWPASRALAWMGGPAGLIVGGSAIVASAAYDALALGGSWLAAGFAAVGAVLYLLDPDPVPRPRQAEAGSVAGRVLFWLACTAVGCVVGFSLACSSAKHTARVTSAAVVDCTAEAFRAGAERYAAHVRDAVVRCGDDWGCVGDAVAELGQEVGLEVAGCAALRVVADMLSPSVAPVDRGRIEAGWDRVRIERLGGRVFELGAVKP